MTSINNIIYATAPSILNPTISITHPIDSLSIFSIPSLYEVTDLLIKSHCTSLTDLLPISLYHTLSPLFSPIYLNIISELTKLWPGFKLHQDCHSLTYFKNKKKP